MKLELDDVEIRQIEIALDRLIRRELADEGDIALYKKLGKHLTDIGYRDE